jgi:cell division protein FtsA
LIDELAKNELLPPAIYLVGGGSGLPDLLDKLEQFPWKERLPFSRDPVIETIQPGMVTTIADPNDLLKNAQDITPMALAYQAVELQDENSALERALTRVIQRMHI